MVISRRRWPFIFGGGGGRGTAESERDHRKKKNEKGKRRRDECGSVRSGRRGGSQKTRGFQVLLPPQTF